MRLYTYNEIWHRKSLLESTADDYSKREAARNLQLYKNNSNTIYAEKFMNTLKGSPELCRMYFESAATITDKFHDNKDIVRTFEEYVVPASKVEDKEFKLNSLDDLDNKTIQDKIIHNMAIDRLIDNDSAINKTGKLDDFIANSVNSTFSTIKCCETVNNYNLPLHGKITVSIEEAMYLMDKYDKKYNDSDVVETVIEYYAPEITSKDIPKINFGIEKNIMTEGYDFEHKFLEGPFSKFDPANKEASCESICNDIFNGYTYKLVSGFNHLLSSIEFSILNRKDPEFCRFLIDKLVPSISHKLADCDNVAKLEFKDKLYDIMMAIDTKVAELNAAIKNLVDPADSETQQLLADFIEALLELNKDIADLKGTISSVPKSDVYNIDRVDLAHVSLPAFDHDYKADILRAADDADKNIANAILARGKAEGSIISKVRDKNIFEANVYEMVDDANRVDYVFAEYNAPENWGDSKDNYLDSICSAVNDINDKYKVYYTGDDQVIDFHITAPYVIEFTDEEKEIHENTITVEDRDKINLIISLADSSARNITTEQAIDAFTECEVPELFTDFIQFCEYANIDKSDVETIYKAVSRTMWNENSLFTESTNAMLDYQVKDAPYDIQLEASYTLGEIIQEAKDAKALSKKIKTGATNLKKTAVNAKDAIKDKFTGDKNKDKKAVKNLAGNDDSHPLKNKLVNLNLALRGFGQKVKDLSAKEKSNAKKVDVQFNHFAKTAKDAVIGDRKEAIIKGQLIPSFSKCVKFAIGEGIAFAIHPLLGIISLFGSIAVSKHIDKKVKLDMLDEIEVELEMVDKEISLAENRNQLKKERALLQTKKQLQRTYQRIKINAKLGKDIIPAGFATPDIGNND